VNAPARLRCALALSLALLAAAPVASAQTAPLGPPAVAEALFQQGRDLMKQERYAEACSKLAESQRLDPKLGTLLNLAVCNEKLGKIATAWAAYVSAEAIARRDGKRERADFAHEQVALLEKRLVRITLQIKAPEPGLELRWDEQSLTGAALDTPFPVDPGQHRLSASAPGKRAWSTTVDVPSDPAQVIPLSIPPLDAAPAPPPATPPLLPLSPSAPPPIALPSSSALSPVAPPPPRTSPLGPRADEPSRSLRVASFASFGAGAAGLLVGVIAGGVTLSRAGTIRAQCPDNRCSADQDGAIRAATTTANVANAGFVIAALGAGSGVVTYLLSRPSSKPGATLSPVLGPTALGLRGSF
jgi:hypothetical protein